MNKLMLRSMLIVLAWGFCLSTVSNAQSSYSNYDELTDRLNQLDDDYGDLTSLTSIGKSSADRDIWALTIGSGDTQNRPAVAVIGGAKGSHIAGSELALVFAEKLLANSSSEEISALLANTTFYVMPRINPDATEYYFSSVKYERDVNNTSTNDDKDDQFDEDPFEDLNDDNLITMMRVEDPTGKWMVHPDDERLLKEANSAKGEKGMYKLFTEGADTDGDGHFNEDPDGGVNINMNFTFDYPYFEDGAGENMASQSETRAVMDFLYEGAPNVFTVVSFTPANNLSSPIKFNRAGVSQRVITGWYEEDVAINELVSEKYNEITGLKGAPDASGQPGDIFQWAYFHYGRYSFSTPGWWTPEVMDEEGNAMKFDSEDARFLAWTDQTDMDAFVEWEEVDHPDFPGKTVEVGGIKPYISYNPPYSMVDSLAIKHMDFIVELASMKPSVELVNFTTEEAGRNLTRVTVDVHNSGILPTASRLGARNNWVHEVVIELQLSDNLNMVSGDILETVDAIEGDGSLQKTWLIRGNGSFTISAGAPNTGISTIEHTIR